MSSGPRGLRPGVLREVERLEEWGEPAGLPSEDRYRGLLPGEREGLGGLVRTEGAWLLLGVLFLSLCFGDRFGDEPCL